MLGVIGPQHVISAWRLQPQLESGIASRVFKLVYDSHAVVIRATGADMIDALIGSSLLALAYSP
ncbi:hypothetical protein GCM10020219_046560 [Nonomuraea dietziae]